MRYNNYHKHDHLSNIFSPDTNTKQEEYIIKALEYGHTNYFTTNHGSFGDIFEARTLCDKYGLRCIGGIEGYIVPDSSEKDKSNYHIIVIPKTDEARKKMNYVSSMANINGFYYKPRFFMTDLLALDKNDIYITTACVAGLLRDENSIEKIFKPLFNHFKNNVLLEVQTHCDPVQIEINKKALYFADQYGLSLIAANDSHYINDDGKQERLELLKGKHINYGSEDDFILDYPTAETMIERFKKQGVLSGKQIDDAINNTLLFDKCEEIKLDHSIKMPTIYPNLTPNQRVSLLKKEVNKRFKIIRKEEKISNEDFKRYRDGIRYEMKIIEDTNDEVHTADYFLFNEKNVDLAVKKYGGVLTRGGRGSCGSFYINRILGMTQLDRFKINLPLFPDRFASTARLLENRSLPDIDFNVKEQEPFVKASRELLGEHGCYPMYAPGTMQISEAFRNVCRSKGMDFDEFNEVAKNLEAYKDDKKWKPIIEEANKYVGTIVSGSVHPCAHILSDKNLLYEYGVTRLGENLCVLITSAEADEYKVLKNDYLIVKVWKLIDETFKEIGIPIIPANELLKSIKDDQRIWDLFKNGITCTLNQVDSDNGSQQAKRYKVSSFEDGAHLTAAIRPSFDSWREQFLNREKYTTGSKQLDEVLKATHGYILFQESLMQYFDWLGVTPAESIGLIKKISKKKIKPEDFKNLEERIKKQWTINTGSEKMFKETWNMIQSCMAYGFCSAHAAATSLDMCYGAYLKVNYPLEYYSVCFNNYSDDQVRTNKLKKELEYFHIQLSDIKFRHSTSKYSYSKENNTIYKGMSSIKFIGDNVGDELFALKDKKYNDFIDLLIDIKNTSVNSKQLEILIKLNFFSEFGEINTLLSQVDYFEKVYGKKQFKIDKLDELGLPKDIVGQHCSKKTEKIWKDFNSVELLKDIISNVQYKETSVLDILNYQQELYGYVSYVLPTANKRLYYISAINSTKYLTTISLYEIYSGKTRTVKMWTSAYNRDPFGEGSILYITSLEKKNKKEPTGEVNPKTGKKIYKEVPDKFEYWLGKFIVKNDVEDGEEDD
jgi:DNA polymerase III alpha subunit